jgi:uncharacterized iron-regulated membrane protein
MKRLRKIIFWCHLSAGVIAGLVILNMSITGLLLAFEQQIVRFAEREMRTVQPPRGEARRLGVQALFAKAREARPDVKPTGLTMQADPSAAAAVMLGRDGMLYMNPYTGELLGEGSKARAFFQIITGWHRWLGRQGESRAAGKAITGLCNAAFLMLAVSGFYLWWPQNWTMRHLSAAATFKPRLRGRARDFNWHTVIGFWSASILIVITATGMVFSYQWAGDLIYMLTGSERPEPPPQLPERKEKSGSFSSSLSGNLDKLWARAEEQAPGWQSISLRLPAGPNAPVTFSITETGISNPFGRSQLMLDPATAGVLRWEPYSSFNLGRTLRSWVRSAHTGEALGLPGQLLFSLVSLGGGFLVWTGLSLALRRFRMWVMKRSRGPIAVTSNSLEGAHADQ